MVRAGVYFEMKETDKALEDIEQAIKLQPHAGPAAFDESRDSGSDQSRRSGDCAVSKSCCRLAPNNEQILNRLGTFYLIANRPRKSIETASQILKGDPDNYGALRFRADAYLNIGKHAEAIADFDKAYTLKEDDESLLNNFAWVLATSPDDKVRDGARALKLATKAAESSGYETPHILSTLAAAYAETGDFENAAKWSQKAVELSQKIVDEAKPEDDKAKLQADRDQLKKELDSYHERKPTRERQTAEDASDTPPLLTARQPRRTAPARTADF